MNDNKLINKFFLTIKNNKEYIKSTIPYITKDSGFFQSYFGIDSLNNDFQTNSFIKEIRLLLEIENLKLKIENGRNLINDYANLVKGFEAAIEFLKDDITRLNKENTQQKNFNSQLENANNQFKNDNVGLNKKINEMDIKINNLMEQQEKTAKKMNEIIERFEKMNLRDTAKMSVRDLFKVLNLKYANEMAPVTKIWDKIKKVVKIISKPEFKKFEFIPNFFGLLILID